MVRHGRQGTLVAFLLALTLTTSVPAAALAGSPDYAAMGLRLVVLEGRGLAQPLSPEEEYDVRLAAKQAGEDPDASVSRHIGVGAVAELATSIELEQPGAFVEWGISRPDEPGRFWMLFKTAPDARMLSAEPMPLSGPPFDGGV